MEHIVYGVDLSQPITPVMARDAMVRCFAEAHIEVLSLMDEIAAWDSIEQREQFRDMQIELRVRKAFDDAGADYDQPTKADLLTVLMLLKKLALEFRQPEIVDKHVAEVTMIIDQVAG